MKKLTNAILFTAMVSGFSVAPAMVSAEEAKSERQAANAVQFRQSLLQLVRSNLGPLGAMAKGQIPYDTEVMSTNAMRLEQLSLMLPDYFKTDTTGFSVETEALPKIWNSMDDFLGKNNDLTVAAKALKLAAQSGDDGQYRAAIGAVGATCKGCHDSYKKD